MAGAVAAFLAVFARLLADRRISSYLVVFIYCFQIIRSRPEFYLICTAVIAGADTCAAVRLPGTYQMMLVELILRHHTATAPAAKRTNL
jgi:hypothetical protein